MLAALLSPIRSLRCCEGIHANIRFGSRRPVIINQNNLSPLRSQNTSCCSEAGIFYKKTYGRKRSSLVSEYQNSACPVYNAVQRRQISDSAPINHECQQLENIYISSELLHENLLESWFFEVDPFGNVDLNIPFNMIIESINPQKYPLMNKAIVRLMAHATKQNNSSTSTKSKIQYLRGLYTFSALVSDDKKKLTLNGSLTAGIEIPVWCHIQVPLKFGICVKSDSNTDVVVRDLESNTVEIFQKNGKTVLQNVKCDKVCKCSSDGDIISRKVLLGNIHLQACGSGKIEADRLQGNTVRCGVESGGVKVQSLYAASSHFIATTSSVHLHSCHGQTQVLIGQGNLDIGALDGDLTATIRKGFANVFASRHNEIRIKMLHGDIKLGLPATATTKVAVHGSAFACDDVFQPQLVEGDGARQVFVLGGDKPTGEQVGNIQLTASDNITVIAQDWLSALKLKADEKQ